MNIKEALSILGLESGSVTPEQIKAAYKKAMQKYHPDRNPAGAEMAKLLNAAYALVQDYEGEYDENTQSTLNYGEVINNALNAIMGLGLTIEICGTWVWVTGETRPHKEVLKAAGYFWSNKKCAWYFRPEARKSRRKGSNWSMKEIREAFGSEMIKDTQKRLAAFA